MRVLVELLALLVVELVRHTRLVLPVEELVGSLGLAGGTLDGLIITSAGCPKYLPFFLAPLRAFYSIKRGGDFDFLHILQQ